MSTEILKNYMSDMQRLSSLCDSDPGALQEILHLIETTKDRVKNDKALEEFFKGEYAYYNGSYERALKHYLEAKGMENFEFFCYRTSAQISKIQGLTDKALIFIKKALSIFPDDFLSKKLQQELFIVDKLSKEDNDLQQDDVETSDEEPKESHDSDVESKRKIGKKEIKELASIFLARHVDDSLFGSDEGEMKPLTASRFKESSASIKPIEKLKHVVDELNLSGEMELRGKEESIETNSAAFEKTKERCLQEYLQQWKNRQKAPADGFYILKGWEETTADLHKYEAYAFLTGSDLQPVGGYYLRWNQCGIVINPGKHFIRNFHRQGFHLRDIDFVVVTDANPLSYAEVLEIHRAVNSLNRLSGELHLVRYYLHQSVFQELSMQLKPQFKQERNVLYPLEFFADSPESEKVDLSPEIRLHYFSIENSSGNIFGHRFLKSIGVRFEFFSKNDNESEKINVAYLPLGLHSPSIDRLLEKCVLTVVNIGNEVDWKSPHPIDIKIEEKQKNRPILLCAGFDGSIGDLRFEIVKQWRNSKHWVGNAPIVLPGDVGLAIDVKKGMLQCGMTSEWLKVEDVFTLHSKGDFSRLRYIDSADVL